MKGRECLNRGARNQKMYLSTEPIPSMLGMIKEAKINARKKKWWATNTYQEIVVIRASDKKPVQTNAKASKAAIPIASVPATRTILQQWTDIRGISYQGSISHELTQENITEESIVNENKWTNQNDVTLLDIFANKIDASHSLFIHCGPNVYNIINASENIRQCLPSICHIHNVPIVIRILTFWSIGLQWFIRMINHYFELWKLNKYDQVFQSKIRSTKVRLLCYVYTENVLTSLVLIIVQRNNENHQ